MHGSLKLFSTSKILNYPSKELLRHKKRSLYQTQTSSIKFQISCNGTGEVLKNIRACQKIWMKHKRIAQNIRFESH